MMMSLSVDVSFESFRVASFSLFACYYADSFHVRNTSSVTLYDSSFQLKRSFNRFGHFAKVSLAGNARYLLRRVDRLAVLHHCQIGPQIALVGRPEDEGREEPHDEHCAHGEEPRPVVPRLRHVLLQQRRQHDQAAFSHKVTTQPEIGT